jgi:hypothetical protein
MLILIASYSFINFFVKSVFPIKPLFQFPPSLCSGQAHPLFQHSIIPIFSPAKGGMSEANHVLSVLEYGNNERMSSL